MDARLKTLPPDFIKRLQGILPPGLFHEGCRGLLHNKPITIRINTLKVKEEAATGLLRRAGVSFVKNRQIPLCYRLEHISLKKVRALPLYQDGAIYLQNSSSQIAPLLLQPRPGDRVLDLCASPGSKTTQMAAMMQNQGHITALEPDQIRYDRLVFNRDLLGATIIDTRKQRGETYCKNMSREKERPYHKVLVDAPCSGEGTFWVNDKASFAHWSLDFVKKISCLQKKLLSLATTACGHSGTILYSTCSLSPEENEAVIDEVMNSTPHLELIDIRGILPLPLFKPALLNWNGVKFRSDIRLTARIYPSITEQGFYLALLRKTPRQEASVVPTPC